LKTITASWAAGIPIMGYNFSIAGVAGRVTGPFARGGAVSVGMDGPFDAPLPRGMVWNMVYDDDAERGFVPPVSHEELWRRHGEFLDELVPVAEEAGVKLAAHPDDPPTPTVRGHARLVYQPHLYQRLLDRRPSSANALEFCLGTLAEMTEGDLYEAVDQYSRQGKLAYVHFRNVTGKAPLTGDIVDDGDIDMIRVLQFKANNLTAYWSPATRRDDCARRRQDNTWDTCEPLSRPSTLAELRFAP
jgi:mannonate dehydratase